MGGAFVETPGNLQEFLRLPRWDEAAARARMQQCVACLHTQLHSLGTLGRDESFAKKGDRIARVQHQHYSAAGKRED